MSLKLARPVPARVFLGAVVTVAVVAGPLLNVLFATAVAASKPSLQSQVTAPEGGNVHWFIRTQEIAREHGLGDMFVRQIKQESHFRDDIISGQTVSWAGATGIAQIIPWMHPEVNPLDPEQSLHYAARFMNELISRYGGDREKALAAYNAGPGTIDWVIGTCGHGWRGCLPPETQEYLAKILVPETNSSPAPPRHHVAAGPRSQGWLSFLDALGQR